MHQEPNYALQSQLRIFLHVRINAEELIKTFECIKQNSFLI